MDADAVDAYVTERLVGPDPVLDAVLGAGLPDHHVSAPQGKFLHLLARLRGARTILEVGTLGGYSTIWLGRALPPGGHLDTLELDPARAALAEAHLAAAGLAGVVTVRTGPAADTLRGLTGPYDLVFIDADKAGNPVYLREALRLTRPGSVVVLDNVVRGGAVVDGSSTDPSVVGTRAAFDLVAAEPRLDATALQTVGSKGWDGFLLALGVD
jgi:predicted O-methyltransferase YrrM